MGQHTKKYFKKNLIKFNKICGLKLFVHLKNIFYFNMAQCILMCLAPGVTREKIHVGVNTLSNSINI